MNLPNKLTMLRIILIPFFMFFYLADFIPHAKIIATVLLIVAELTDLLDGYFARKHNLVTDFGKLMDPVADKSCALTAMILLAIDGTIPSPYGAIVIVIFLIRDFVVTGLRQIAASKNVVIPADKWGKIKSLLLDIALPMFFFIAYLTSIGFGTAIFTAILYVVAFVMLALSTVFSIYSGINYLVKNKQLIKW